MNKKLKVFAVIQDYTEPHSHTSESIIAIYENIIDAGKKANELNAMVEEYDFSYYYVKPFDVEISNH